MKPRRPLTLLGSGAFADVYDLGDGTVVKAFWAHARHPASVRDARKSFEAEKDAYRRLQEVSDLAGFAPRYFGPVAVPSAREGPEDHVYPRNCALRLEKVPGECRKVAALRRHPLFDQIDATLQRFQEVLGVDDPWDASCFIPGARAPFTLIDFATPTNDLDLAWWNLV